MYAAVNQTKLFFDVNGDGVTIRDGDIIQKPVMFVLHGGPGGSHLNFKPHLDTLTEQVQLVYVDQRGCGYSEEGDPETYTLEQNVADIDALREYLGLEKIWILGHSYGGMVAMQYALQYQEKLSGLVLCTTSSSYRFIEKAKAFVEENGNEEQKKYAYKLWDGDFQSEEELQEYYHVMDSLYAITSAKPSSKKKAKVKRSYQALNQGFGGFLRSFDITDQLKNIKVPTLILAGRYDWITPVSENEVIHQEISNSSFHVLENSSHSLFVDQNEESLSLIGEFLGKEHT
ncbi:alpha/beta fold hydrolase [Virgibacillus ndiopensis]|uniref:alpha/beta fold hydrolase n=1 Tax=Virgibacillus ndiopensis TaxID=2004408 RepID=UPI000C0872F8|nr:alpha/beta fold hydrolase [Virgibacillus ndiopensis]